MPPQIQFWLIVVLLALLVSAVITIFSMRFYYRYKLWQKKHDDEMLEKGMKIEQERAANEHARQVELAKASRERFPEEVVHR